MKFPLPRRLFGGLNRALAGICSPAAWVARPFRKPEGSRRVSSNGAKETPAEGRDAMLVCSEAEWKALRDHLIQSDGLEHVAFLLLGERNLQDRTEYLLHRLLPVDDANCSRQSQVIIEPDTASVLDCFAKYTGSEAAVFAHAHSHPFTGSPTFSAGDDAYLPGHLDSFVGYLKSASSDRPRRFLRLVCGNAEDGFSAEVYDEDRKCLHRIREIRLVGATGARVLTASHRGILQNNEEPETVIERNHLDRNIRWLGEEGQRCIAGKRIAICGLGGIGVEILKHCRGLGFRHFTLIDPDRLEASNLNRLIWSAEDVGRTKVELATEFVRALEPEAEIRTFASGVEESECREMLESADIIVSAVDSDAARLHLQVLAARHLIPLIDLGAGIHLETDGKTVSRMGGQVSCYVPGGPCLSCQGLNVGAIMDKGLREVREAVGYVRGTNESPPSVGTVNSIVAGIAGDLIVRLATGFSEIPLWTGYDMLKHETRRLDFSKKPGCRICGDEGIEGLGNGTVAPLPAKATDEEILENPGSSSLARSSQSQEAGNGSEEIDPDSSLSIPDDHEPMPSMRNIE